jgi:hypothetical protein
MSHGKVTRMPAEQLLPGNGKAAIGAAPDANMRAAHRVR